MAIVPHRGTPLTPETHSGPNRAAQRAQRFGSRVTFCQAHDTQTKAGTGRCQRCRRGRRGAVKPLVRNLTPVVKLMHDADRMVNRIGRLNEEAA
jgi:hypothetical protein